MRDTDEPARHGADDRRARQRHARRAALDSRVRARRRRAPGSYTVSGLSTITNALYASGGVKPIGSLRNIALRRDGDDGGDARSLRPAAARRYARRRAAAGRRRDFRAARRRAVTVDGEVRRPAIYEVKDEETVAELIALAGGLNAAANRTAREARARRAESRHDGAGHRPRDGGAQTAVRDGDVLRVPAESRAARELRAVGGQRVPAGPLPMAPGHAADAILLPAPELVKPHVGPELRADTAGGRAERRNRGPFGGSAGGVAGSRRRRKRLAASRAIPCTCSISRRAGGQIVAPLIEELEAQAAPQRAAARGTRRRASACAGRVPARARHAHQRPAARRRRVERSRVRHGRGADALYGRQRRVPRDRARHRQSRGVLRGDAAADLAIGAVRLPEHQRGVALARRGVGDDPRRGRVPRHLPDSARREAVVVARACRRPDGSRLPRGQRVHARRAPGARARAARGARAAASSATLPRSSITDPSASHTITAGQSLVDQLRTAVATGRWVIRLDDDRCGQRSDADVVLKDGDHAPRSR